MSEALSQQIFGTTTAWWGDGRNRTTPPVFVSDLELLRQSMPVAADRLTHLSGLKDGWNGDGSIRISRTSLEVCAELLCSLASCSHHLVRLAFISPLSSGGIELEWDSLHSKDLLLSIPTNGSPIEYLISHPDSGDTIEEGIVGTQEAICLFKTERCNQLSTMVFPVPPASTDSFYRAINPKHDKGYGRPIPSLWVTVLEGYCRALRTDTC